MKKRTLTAWLLVLAMLLSLLPAAAFAASGGTEGEETAAKQEAEETATGQGYQLAAEIVASGTCGDNLTWTLDEDGVLTISGTGDMYDFTGTDDQVWADYADDITAAVIEQGVTSIGDAAFFRCYYMRSADIPDTVTNIGGGAFECCYYLDYVDIPDSVTSIGVGAFISSGLNLITIGDGLASIGDMAFDYQTCMIVFYGDAPCICEEIIGENGYGHYSYGAFEDATITAYYPVNNDTWTAEMFEANYGENSNVTWIPYESLSDELAGGTNTATNGSTITWSLDFEMNMTVTGPGTLEYNMIDYYTTRYMLGVKTLEIGKDVELGDYPFWELATNLTSVTFCDGTTEIGDEAFWNCPKLVEVTIPDSVTSIGNSAFYGCENLTQVTIPDSVTSIGQYAFGYYGDEDSPEKMDDFTIYGYTYSAAELYANENGFEFVSIGYATYEGTCGDDLTWILTTEDGVLTISGTGDMNDYWSFKVTGLDISSYIKTVVIENGATSIGSSAFSRCANLTDVTIPDSVTTIGYDSFAGCTLLTSVSIPASVTEIGDFVFLGCTGLTEIQVSADNTAYCSVDGVLFTKDMTQLICYPAGKTDTSYTIPDTVTSFSDYAFYGCTSLTSVTIPNSVTDLGYFAFWNCTGLTSVTIPGSVTEIRYYDFAGCTNLASVTIDDGVASIGSCAFLSCASLTNVTIPGSVTTIGYATFCGTGLTSVTIGSGTTSIYEAAFMGCADLSSISIPDSVTVIGYQAFSECTSLADVYYSGSEDDWNGIYFYEENDCLTSATIHYNSTGPDEEEPHTHNYTSAVTKAATCTETGVRTYTCSCGDSYTETIPATGHTPGEAVKENVVEATATTNGAYDSVVYYTTCGTELGRETITIPATGTGDSGT